MFNTNAFSAADVAPYTFGDSGRNLVDGPGLVELDAAIQRSFALTHRFSMPIRFEVFNVANKPNFFNPFGSSSQIGTSSFGSITQANDPREMQLSAKIIW